MFSAFRHRFCASIGDGPQAGQDFSAATMYEAAYAVGSSAPVLATQGGNLTIDGQACGEFEFYRSSSDVSLASWSPGFFHLTTRHNICSFVYINGNLTVNSGLVVAPGNRRHFVCYYIKGNLVLNGKLSMTGMGAAHGLASVDNAGKGFSYNDGTFASGAGNQECVAYANRIRVDQDTRNPWVGSNVAAVDIPVHTGLYPFTMGRGPYTSNIYNTGSGPVSYYYSPRISAAGGAGGAATSRSATSVGLTTGNNGDGFDFPIGSNNFLLAKSGGGGGGSAWLTHSYNWLSALGGSGGAGTCFTGGTGGGSGRNNGYSGGGSTSAMMKGSPNGMAGGWGANDDDRAGGIGSPGIQEYRGQTVPPYYSCEASVLGLGQGGTLVVFVEGTITGTGSMESKGTDHAANQQSQTQGDIDYGGLSGGASGGGIIMSFCTNGSSLLQDTSGGISQTFGRKYYKAGNGGAGSSYRFSW